MTRWNLMNAAAIGSFLAGCAAADGANPAVAPPPSLLSWADAGPGDDPGADEPSAAEPPRRAAAPRPIGDLQRDEMTLSDLGAGSVGTAAASGDGVGRSDALGGGRGSAQDGSEDGSASPPYPMPSDEDPSSSPPYPMPSDEDPSSSPPYPMPSDEDPSSSPPYPMPSDNDPSSSPPYPMPSDADGRG